MRPLGSFPVKTLFERCGEVCICRFLLKRSQSCTSNKIVGLIKRRQYYGVCVCCAYPPFFLHTYRTQIQDTTISEVFAAPTPHSKFNITQIQNLSINFFLFFTNNASAASVPPCGHSLHFPSLQLFFHSADYVLGGASIYSNFCKNAV